MSNFNNYNFGSFPSQTFSQQNTSFMPAQKVETFSSYPASGMTSTTTTTTTVGSADPDMLRRFQHFDRNQDGLLSRDEIRCFMMSFYGEHPPQAMIDTVDEHLFLNDAYTYDFARASELAAKVRSKNYTAPAPAPKPALVSTPFGNVPTPQPSTQYSGMSMQQPMMQSAPMQSMQQPMMQNTSFFNPTQYQQPAQFQQPAQPSFSNSLVPYQPTPAQTNTFSTTVTPFSSSTTASAFPTSYGQSFPSATSSLPTPLSTGFTSAPPTASLPKATTSQGGMQSMAAALSAAGGLPSTRSLTSKAPASADVASTASVGTHYISKEEQRAFSEYINTHPILSQDPDLKGILPLNPMSDDLYTAVSSGVLFCKFLNAVRPDTVANGHIKIRPRSVFEQTENQTLAIAGAKKLGCQVVNIGPSDLIEGKAHLVLGMVWQIIRVDLLSKVTVQQHPELCRLIGEGNAATGEAPMSLQQMQQISPEQVLLRWLNHHLRNAGYNKSVNNFSSDIQDGSAYTVLLNKLAPELISLDGLRQDPATRANNVCAAASRLGCGKFVTPADIMSGNARLNLAFVADLFNRHPGIALPSMEELERLRRQNAAMASVLAEAEARLRQLAADRQIAEALQNQEIMLAREREAQRQREIAEGEAFARAAQEAEERQAREENDRRTAEMLQSEAYLQREMAQGPSQVQSQSRPPARSQEYYAPPRPSNPAPSAISYSSSSYTRPPPKSSSSSSSSSRSSSNSGSGTSTLHSYSSGAKKKGLFERAGHKVDKKLTQFKDVKRYN